VTEWSDADAWVFSSLTGPGREHGVALWQVLFQADAINHLGLGEDEFTVAARRLIAAGLMDADPGGDCYWLTQSGYDLRHQLLPDPRHYVWQEAVPPGLSRLGEPAAQVLVLPTGAFRRATKRHRKEFWATYRRIQAELAAE
jgi:hypothetical protein